MKGRPAGSFTRENILKIVAALGISYGYEIYKIYREFFGRITLRNVYYNLRKGVELLQLAEVGAQEILGNFTWGRVVERKYYILGPLSKINDAEVEELRIRIKGENTANLKINWESLSKKYYNFILEELRKIEGKRRLQRGEVRNFEEKVNSILNWLGYHDIRIENLIKQNLENLKGRFRL